MTPLATFVELLVGKDSLPCGTVLCKPHGVDLLLCASCGSQSYELGHVTDCSCIVKPKKGFEVTHTLDSRVGVKLPFHELQAWKYTTGQDIVQGHVQLTKRHVCITPETASMMSRSMARSILRSRTDIRENLWSTLACVCPTGR